MILLLKLNDGTEIIGDVEEVTDGYSCSKIMQIVTRADNNQLSVGLVPFMSYADQEEGILLPAAAMMVLAMPGKELLERYNKLFSKIIVPESKIVMG